MALAAGADYPALFRVYVQQSARPLLRRAQASSGAPTEQMRQQAWHALSYSLQLPEGWPDSRDLLLALAPKMEQAGHRDDWMPFLQQGLAISREVGDARGTAALLFQMGLLQQRQSQLQAARQSLSESVAIYERLDDHVEMRRSFNRLAFVARLERRFDEARELAQTALSIAPFDPHEAAYSHLVLGAIATDNQAWQRARECFEQSLALLSATDDVRLRAWSHSNLGIAFSGIGRYPDAIYHFQQAIILLAEIQDSLYLANTRVNLGNTYVAMAEYESALAHFQAAEDIFRRLQDKVRIAAIEANRGFAFQKMGRLRDAQAVYERNVLAWRALDQLPYLVNTLDNLGEVLLAQGAWGQAQGVFESALQELHAKATDASLDALRDMVNAHLQEAKNQAPDQGA